MDPESGRSKINPVDFPFAPSDQLQRFVTKFRKNRGCWVWTGAIGCRGYALFWLGGKRHYGHRVAYRWAHGEDAPATIDHVCRRRHCVNPSHLEAVTLEENVMRGIAPPAMNARKSHCKYGHPFDEKNTIRVEWRGKLKRKCRSCLQRFRHVPKPTGPLVLSRAEIRARLRLISVRAATG